MTTIKLGRVSKVQRNIAIYLFIQIELKYVKHLQQRNMNLKHILLLTKYHPSVYVLT